MLYILDYLLNNFWAHSEDFFNFINFVIEKLDTQVTA